MTIGGVTTALANPLQVNQSLLNEASAPRELSVENGKQKDELHETFNQFVGELFFSQMLSSMRKTVDKPAYFHGGRAEEIFQGQMDQIFSEQMAKSSAEQFADPMFEQWKLASLTRS